MRLGALTCAGALFVTGCASETPRPNVLIVVIDTLRADRLGVYGSTRGLTPFLDELATRGVVFERAYAPSSWTSPSVATLLTSRHPLQHGMNAFGSVLGAGELSLAEVLRGLGYRTAGFAANLLLAEHSGLGQGFEHWRVYLAEWVNRDGDPKVRGGHLRREALAWLDANTKPTEPQPVLLYLHLMDVHTPYDPPPPQRQRFALGHSPADEAMRARLHDRHAPARFGEFTDEEVARLEALYDAEVAALDEELRRLFSQLDERGFLANALVLVAADHGEEFREHDALLHGTTLYEAGVRVPLILLAPGLEPGRRVAEPVSLIDVAPTILALLGAEVPAPFEGRGLLPERRAAAGTAEADVLLDLAQQQIPEEQRTHAVGLVRGSRKLLVDPQGRARVYDLARDPVERDASAESEAGAELVVALRRARDALGLRAAAPTATTAVDAETRARLRALGYATEPDPAPDPSERR
jgi:arylsulfatase A-like enzyme